MLVLDGLPRSKRRNISSKFCSHVRNLRFFVTCKSRTEMYSYLGTSNLARPSRSTKTCTSVSLLSVVSWLRDGQVDTKLTSVSAFSVKPPLRKTTHLEDAK